MNLASYLCLDGQEIINGNRSLTYARTADPRLTVGLVDNPVAEPNGHVPENLACFCAGIEDPDRVAYTVTYTDPATDDAPWYDPDHPESEEFLGMHATVIRLTAGMSRAVTPTGFLGSTIGQLRKGHRVLQVEAVMFATTPAGMQWGERWLNQALAQCAAGQASVVTDCADTEGS